MSILSLASRNSAARGYDYFQRKKVLSIEKVDEGVFKSRVSGSDGKRYDVYIDTAHPRRSKCRLPLRRRHAQDVQAYRRNILYGRT